MSCRRVRKKRSEHLRSFTICCASAHGAEGLLSSVTCYSSSTPQCPALMFFFPITFFCVFVFLSRNAVFHIITLFLRLCLQQLWSNPLVCCLVKCLSLRSTSFISQLVERRRSVENRQNKQTKTNSKQTHHMGGLMCWSRGLSFFSAYLQETFNTHKKNL